MEQFFSYQVTQNSRKVLLVSFHWQGEAGAWMKQGDAWMKHAYKDLNKEKFVQLNLGDKVHVQDRVMISRKRLK